MLRAISWLFLGSAAVLYVQASWAGPAARGVVAVHEARVQPEDATAEVARELRLPRVVESKQARSRRVAEVRTASFMVATVPIQRIGTGFGQAKYWPVENTRKRCSDMEGCCTAVPPPNAV